MKYFNPKQAAEILSTSCQRLANLRHAGEGPPYSKIGCAIRYGESDLVVYMENSRIVPRKTEEKKNEN